VPHDVSIYRMSDDTAAFEDTPRTFASLEREICGRVDLVLATARSLVLRAREMNARRVLHLPNACDPGAFDVGTASEPYDLRGVPRPRAVYAGAIERWLDVGLLADTARLLPGWSFVLIGPVRAGLGPLRGLPNVRAEWTLLATAFNLRTLWRIWQQCRPAGRGALTRPAAA